MKTFWGGSEVMRAAEIILWVDTRRCQIDSAMTIDNDVARTVGS